MVILNVVWPALYVLGKLKILWWLIFVTITIEGVFVKKMLNFSYKKSFLISTTGNIVSGLFGTFALTFGMLLWHAIFDDFFNNSTFSNFNWVVTYLIMCLGSVLIETLFIRKLWKIKLRRIFVPLLLGNLISYTITLFANIDINL